MIKADNLVKKYGNFELDISMEVQEVILRGLWEGTEPERARQSS